MRLWANIIRAIRRKIDIEYLDGRELDSMALGLVMDSGIIDEFVETIQKFPVQEIERLTKYNYIIRTSKSALFVSTKTGCWPFSY